MARRKRTPKAAPVEEPVEEKIQQPEEEASVEIPEEISENDPLEQLLVSEETSDPGHFIVSDEAQPETLIHPALLVPEWAQHSVELIPNLDAVLIEEPNSFSRIDVPEDITAIGGFYSWTTARKYLEAPDPRLEGFMWMVRPIRTSSHEIMNIARTASKARSESNHLGRFFVFNPGDYFAADRWVLSVIHYVDAIILPGELLQNHPERFGIWMNDQLRFINNLDDINPLITIQVSAAHGTAQQMYAAMQTITEPYDSVAITPQPAQPERVREFVGLLRP